MLRVAVDPCTKLGSSSTRISHRSVLSNGSLATRLESLSYDSRYRSNLLYRLYLSKSAACCAPLIWCVVLQLLWCCLLCSRSVHWTRDFQRSLSGDIEPTSAIQIVLLQLPTIYEELWWISHDHSSHSFSSQNVSVEFPSQSMKSFVGCRVPLCYSRLKNLRNLTGTSLG